MMNPIQTIPTATYRLQFHKGFTFSDARQIVPYLRRLGISHVYSSPISKATPGSLHGYDVADHNVLNPELGTREDFDALSESLREHGMGLVLDFVPNHMGIAEPSNRWWMDVLENGPSSPFAKFFDIDWRPLKRELENKVLLPILGDQYGRVLERGELKLGYAEGAFTIAYFDNQLPVGPRTAMPVLKRALEIAKPEVPEEALSEFESILTALEYLPSRFETAPDRIVERARERQVIKRRLRTLCSENPAVEQAIQRTVQDVNDPAGPDGFDTLDQLISAQCYRLSFWRVAGEEINYRRFFDINSLAAIRMELPEVFDAAHQLVFELLSQRAITGLRIDHVDGLYDPLQYLESLQTRAAEILGESAADKPLYLAVEKILAPTEHIPRNWPVHGTTGYEFANQVVNILIDSSAEKSMTETYYKFIERNLRFHDIVYRSKLLVMRSAMSSEVNVLGAMLNRLSETNRWYRDFTLNALTTAVREVIACFPVYRTYIRPDEPASDEDKKVISKALSAARRRNPALEQSVFEFLREVLIPAPNNAHPVDEEARRQFVLKFQQCSGPITAKGVEDTAFYIYNRLAALNEVGGEPGNFGSSLETFHAQNAARLAEVPSCMLATSTHDTKRSEDVRARIAALSEIPDEWAQAVRRWHVANRKFKRDLEGEIAPDLNEEYLLYQTMVGSWPLEPLTKSNIGNYVERLQGYMQKAIREAKVNSSWIEPHQAWDDAVRDFVASVATRKRFLNSFEPVAERIAEIGMVNALTQTLLKLTVPGAPDFYQGNETWDFSLVDPDNRRPVDYAARQQALDSLSDSADPKALLENWRDGRIKMFAIHRVLQLRLEHPEVFQQGGYTPQAVTGTFANCVIAFCRNLGERKLLVVVPRLSSKVGFPPIGDLWKDTAIESSQRWKNIFTGEEHAGTNLPLSAALRDLPFGVFTA